MHGTTALAIPSKERVWDFLKMSHRPVIRDGKQMKERRIDVKDSIQWCFYLPPPNVHWRFKQEGNVIWIFTIEFHKVKCFSKVYWRKYNPAHSVLFGFELMTSQEADEFCWLDEWLLTGFHCFLNIWEINSFVSQHDWNLLPLSE